MSKPQNLLSWDIYALAKAMKIPESDVREYFTDGRKVSFVLERRLAYEFFHGSLAPSEGEDYDVMDSVGAHWEVRSITSGGVYFCPSYMVGSGRSFDERGFMEKLDGVKGYVLADVVAFPYVPFWIIPTETVRTWWKTKMLGTTTKISRDKALALIEKL
ncbi:MAG: hypothetical protein QXL94_06925 [Candidatus Parvarchaeum sp.]